MRCTRLSAYHTSISSAPIRASTDSPINRAGTEYVLCCTWIVLPRRTRTRTRSCVSRRPAGNMPSRGNSSANAPCRPALRRSVNSRRNLSYS